MKAIIIGSSLSGKTTLIKYLRVQNSTLHLKEMDELLAQENNDFFPTDIEQKNKLAQIIIHKILDENEIIFFTNTDYFTLTDLKIAKEKGFKIFQLVLGIEELQKRNADRIKNNGYEDQSQWFDGMLRYQKEIKDVGLIDEELDANLSTALLATNFLSIIK